MMQHVPLLKCTLYDGVVVNARGQVSDTSKGMSGLFRALISVLWFCELVYLGLGFVLNQLEHINELTALSVTLEGLRSLSRRI